MASFQSMLDDDDSDFMTGGSNKLKSLFSGEAGSSGNEDLTYRRPEQPKKAAAAAAADPSDTAQTVQHAVAVQAFKYVGNQSQSQGKLGLAILGNYNTKKYNLLFYDSTKKTVADATLNSKFPFTIQENNYATFYDNKQQAWSVRFDNAELLAAFCKQLCVAKFNASLSDGIGDLVFQDLVCGSKDAPGVAIGESVEVKYVGYLHTDGKYGKEVLSAEQGFRFKVGKGKVIQGWDQGVIGMKKSTKRVIAVPTHMAYAAQGSGDNIPANAHLIYEMDLRKHKTKSGDKGEKAEKEKPATDTLAAPETRERSASIESTASAVPDDPGANQRQRLLERMSKMGQAMLPTPSSPVVEGGAPEAVVTPVPQQAQAPQQQQQPQQQPMQQPQQQPQPQPQPQQQQQQQFQPPQYAQPQQQFQQQQPQQQQQFGNQPYQPYGYYRNPQALSLYQPPSQQANPFQQPPMPGQPGQSGQPGQPDFQQNPFQGPPPPPMDAYTQGMRDYEKKRKEEDTMDLLKGMSKSIDDVSKKIDGLKESGALTSFGGGQFTPNMESMVLMHNIQRIIQDSERLKKEVFEKSARIEQQNDKIQDLLTRNQKFVEESNLMLEQRNDSFKQTTAQAQARVLELEQEKVRTSDELTNTTQELAKIKAEFTALQSSEAEARNNLRLSKEESARLEGELAAVKAGAGGSAIKVEELTKAAKEEKASRKEAESKIEALEEQVTELTEEKASLAKKLESMKKKLASDRDAHDTEIEDLKTQSDKELDALRKKLRKEKQNSDALVSERVAAAEEEAREDWEAKLKKAVASAEERASNKYTSLEEDYQELEKRLSDSQTALKAASSGEQETALATQLDAARNEISKLKESSSELKDQLQAAKDAAAVATTTAAVADAGDSFESGKAAGLEELKAAVEAKEAEIRKAMEDQVKAAYAKGKKESGDAPAAVAGTLTVDDVKRTMNGVYQLLKQKFTPGESYTAKQIMDAVLSVVREATLHLVTPKEDSEDDDEDDDDDDDEDEDEDEEEDEDDDDEEAEERTPEAETSKDEALEDKQEVTPAADAKDEDDEDEEEAEEDDVEAEEEVPAAEEEAVEDDDDAEEEADTGAAEVSGKASSEESWVAVEEPEEEPETHEEAEEVKAADEDDDEDSDDVADEPAPAVPTAVADDITAAADDILGGDDDDEDEFFTAKKSTKAASPVKTAKAAGSFSEVFGDDDDGEFFTPKPKKSAPKTKKDSSLPWSDDDDEDDMSWLK